MNNVVVNFSSPACFSEATVASNGMIILYVLFLSLAFISVLALRRTETSKGKITLVYMHLIFLFMPVALLSTNSACGMTCSSCHNNLPVLTLYAVPITAAAAAFFGFVGIPFYYTFSSRRVRAKWVNDFVKTHSAKLKIRVPNIRLLDSAKPKAFSFRSLRSGIFLSVGMMEVLTKKETEAVLLHELAHIKRYASAGKFSQRLMLFSPFYKLVAFNGREKEEEEADSFAISVQGTSRHIESAREKLDEFY